MKKLLAMLLAASLVMSMTAPALAADDEADIHLVTDVYGDGQKAWYVVLDYGTQIDPDSVAAEDYAVDGYEIIGAYTNGEAVIPEESVAGEYVLVELSTDYTTTNYGGPGVNTGSDSSGGQSGRGGAGALTGGASNQLSVTIRQVGEISSIDGSVLPAWDDGIATDSEENDNLQVKNFEQLVFAASDGTELMYNLFVPESYDEGESYPILLFMPDATGEGGDPVRTLTESLGSVIWSGEQWQQEHPCIVLCPQYVNENSSDPVYTVELVQEIESTYSVDESRIYTVGQSSGTIRSIKLMIDYPGMFAGGMLVAGQAEGGYEDLVGGLAGQNIWLICSAGDVKAYPGMQSIVDAVEDKGEEVTIAQWSAKLSDEEQEALAAEQAASGTAINWTIFDAETVMEDDVTPGAATEHMNTWRVAYNLDTVRQWLFEQTNG